MLLHLIHRTTFVYAGPVQDSFNEVRLYPVSDATQQCRSFDLRLSPSASTRSYADFYGNTVHYFDVAEHHTKLVIEAASVVETTPLADRPAIPVVSVTELERSPEREMVAEFYSTSHYVPLEVELWREAQDALASGRADVWSDVRRLGEHVRRTFTYMPKTTGVNTRATEALKLRTGVCQDFAPRAMSAAIFSTTLAGRAKSKPRTPGSKHTFPDTVGPRMIRRTTVPSTNVTSRLLSAVTTATSVRSTAPIAARPPVGSRLKFRSERKSRA